MGAVSLVGAASVCARIKMDKVSEVFLWKKRLSVVYAAGAWLVVGSLGYIYAKKVFSTKKHISSADENLPDVFEPEKPIQEVKPKPFYYTEVKYKENFVPYTTRLYNFVKSIMDKDSEKSIVEKGSEK